MQVPCRCRKNLLPLSNNEIFELQRKQRERDMQAIYDGLRRQLRK